MDRGVEVVGWLHARGSSAFRVEAPRHTVSALGGFFTHCGADVRTVWRRHRHFHGSRQRTFSAYSACLYDTMCRDYGENSLKNTSPEHTFKEGCRMTSGGSLSCRQEDHNLYELPGSFTLHIICPYER